MSKFKIGWTVKVINYGSAPKMTMESRGHIIEITEQDGVYWYGVKFNTKYDGIDAWWYEERNLEQVWPVDEKKYKRVFAKDIKVGDLCLGTDRSIIYKVKAVEHNEHGTVQIHSSPVKNQYEAWINTFDKHAIVHVVEEEPMTTSVEDIQKEIAKAQETLNQLQKKLDEEKNKKWEPKGGDWYVNHKNSRAAGLEFETSSSADKASAAYRRYHRLYKLAEELNEGWEPDWEETDQKFYIYYDHGSKKYDYCYHNSHQTVGGVYFKDVNTTKKALEIIKNGGLD